MTAPTKGVAPLGSTWLKLTLIALRCSRDNWAISTLGLEWTPHASSLLKYDNPANVELGSESSVASNSRRTISHLVAARASARVAFNSQSADSVTGGGLHAMEE